MPLDRSSQTLNVDALQRAVAGIRTRIAVAGRCARARKFIVVMRAAKVSGSKGVSIMAVGTRSLEDVASRAHRLAFGVSVLPHSRLHSHARHSNPM